LRLEDADKRIQRARARFEAYLSDIEGRAIAPQTIR